MFNICAILFVSFIIFFFVLFLLRIISGFGWCYILFGNIFMFLKIFNSLKSAELILYTIFDYFITQIVLLCI